MRIKFFFLFLMLSSLACMKQADEVSNAILKNSEQISVTPVEATKTPKSKPTNAPNTAPAIVYVTALETLNIRSNHSSEAEILGYLINGEDVMIYECWGDWARIGTSRWVNSFYLSKQCP